MFLSKRHSVLLLSEFSFKWRSEKLHIEKGVYHSPILAPKESWRKVFLRNKEKKMLWENVLIESTTQKFKIKVCARFKPKLIANEKESGAIGSKSICLPLHQRLAIIRMNKKISSNKDAFKVLEKQGGWFGKEMKERYSESKTNDSRKHHLRSNLGGGVQFIDSDNNSVVLLDRLKGLREFYFDHVMPEKIDQKSMYEISSMGLVSDFINCVNSTVLVYGQTGSGKTWTMFGENKSLHVKGEKMLPPFGVVPRSCHQIFDALDFRRRNLKIDIEAKLSISYIEVYGNDVTDLLRCGKPCGRNKVSAQRHVLDGSAEIPVKTLAEVMALLEKGEKQKRKASTAMNSRSSRAHSILIITLQQECKESKVCSTSHLFLADLGGSEQIKKSQPFNSNDFVCDKLEVVKDRLREAVYINLGLLALKRCVTALRTNTHVPYSDSKLTMILSSGLGGNSKTSLIVCGDQSERHDAETISTMMFGQTCRGILRIAYYNTNMIHNLLGKLDQRISECETNIKKHERWESKKEKRFDESGRFLGTWETTTVVGAETLRKELAYLIQQKIELTGSDIELS